MSDETQEQETEQTATQEQPPAQPAPQYITMEQFTQAMGEMREGFQQTVQSLVQGLRQPIAASGPVDAEPSDDEIDNAAIEGRGVGRAVKRAIAIATKRARQEATQEVEQVRGVGLPALNEIALNQAKANWTHYDRFKKEVDQAISGLTIEQRAMPSFLQVAYDVVIGKHQKQLEKEAIEAATRQLRESGELQPTNRAVKPDPKLDPTNYFGREDMDNLERNNKSIEHLARRLGKTPEQYLATVERYRKRNSRQTAAA